MKKGIKSSIILAERQGYRKCLFIIFIIKRNREKEEQKQEQLTS